MISRLMKLNAIEMTKMCVYAFGPVALTIYCTKPEVLDKYRLHLKKWYGIECVHEPAQYDEDEFQIMLEKRLEESNLKIRQSETEEA